MWSPVSEKNTSSSDGCRTSMLSTSTPASSSARTTTVARPVDESTPALSVRPSSLTETGPDTSGAMAPTAEACGSAKRHLQAGAPARLLQFLRRPVRNDPAVVDDHDVVGQLVGLLQVLRRQQDGDALAEQLADGFPDPLPRTSGPDPVVGSSRNSTGGRVIREPARSSRRRMPPE